ncbi:hypothetical protein CDAR_305551 [Caerostris darwini]|uniref:Uncharacterized protein n=1 Tax=Caerostris darwini TaxID=1538125 RepID=A0AAV4MAZ1_9ARAC|nr:hypothetical protein CDAR_305551 [Caerostris darwini]
MNSSEIECITRTVVSQYRKFVSWWTVLNATSVVLDSNFQSIVHYLEANSDSQEIFQCLIKGITKPMNLFSNSSQLVKENLNALTEEVTNLIELSSSNNPVSEEDLLDVYDIIHELQEDLKENFGDCKKHFIDYKLRWILFSDCFVTA